MCRRRKGCRYLILLSGDLVLQLKLLRLQLVHPLPQLLGFPSVRCASPSTSGDSCSPPQPAAHHLLEPLLVHIFNLQRFTPLAQDLLLLLSLCLPFATTLFGLGAGQKDQDLRLGYLKKKRKEKRLELLGVLTSFCMYPPKWRLVRVFFFLSSSSALLLASSSSLRVLSS